jgi:hypothetical protein
MRQRRPKLGRCTSLFQSSSWEKISRLNTTVNRRSDPLYPAILDAKILHTGVIRATTILDASVIQEKKNFSLGLETVKLLLFLQWLLTDLTSDTKTNKFFCSGSFTSLSTSFSGAGRDFYLTPLLFYLAPLWILHVAAPSTDSFTQPLTRFWYQLENWRIT